MGPLIMIHAWVHLSASLQPPLNTLTAGHSITSDSVSPICVTGTKTYDSPPQPTAPVSEVINFSSSRCGDGDPGNMGRGSQSLMSVICMMHVWHQDDPEMTHGHWPPSHLIGTQRRSPHGIMATGMTLGHPGLGSYSIGTGNGSWLCLIHFIIPPWPGSSLIPPVPGVIQLVHNHNERRRGVTHHSWTGTSREGK